MTEPLVTFSEQEVKDADIAFVEADGPEFYSSGIPEQDDADWKEHCRAHARGKELLKSYVLHTTPRCIHGRAQEQFEVNRLIEQHGWPASAFWRTPSGYISTMQAYRWTALWPRNRPIRFPAAVSADPEE